MRDVFVRGRKDSVAGERVGPLLDPGAVLRAGAAGRPSQSRHVPREQHKVDGAPGGGLQTCGQATQGAGGQLDGNVCVAIRAPRPTGTGAEEQRVSDTGLGIEDATKHVQRAASVARA